MFTILFYDIKYTKSNSRANKIRRLVTKYLPRVQYSVYEGHLEEAMFIELSSKIEKIADLKEDSIIIYRISNKSNKKFIIGRELKNITVI